MFGIEVPANVISVYGLFAVLDVISATLSIKVTSQIDETGQAPSNPLVLTVICGFVSTDFTIVPGITS